MRINKAEPEIDIVIPDPVNSLLAFSHPPVSNDTFFDTVGSGKIFHIDALMVRGKTLPLLGRSFNLSHLPAIQAKIVSYTDNSRRLAPIIFSALLYI